MKPTTSETKPEVMPLVAWPRIEGRAVDCLRSLLKSLAETQYFSSEKLAEHGRIQLGVLAEYAAKHCQHFANRLARAGIKPSTLTLPGGLEKLDILRRRDIQSAGAALRCTVVPPRHMPLNKAETSGSTGEPVVVIRTALNRLFWMAMTMREHNWNTRDFSRRMSSVRANIPKLAYSDTWGPPASLLHQTGRSQGIPITADAAQQAVWIRQFDPAYLMHYPNSLASLAAYVVQHEIKFPGLRQIRSIGETLSAHTKALAENAFGVPVIDTYSSNEVGVIALQCSASGLYHIMSENLIVEVLREDGSAAAEGEIGRVVITDLHNFATPLIRYDIGDYAELGGPCSCGRELPTLKRILGRERNLVRMPDGTTHWPLLGFAAFRDVAPLIQYQFVQHDLKTIEFRIVAERPLTAAEETALRGIAQEALGHKFNFKFVYYAEVIPRGRGGKFEEFICLINDP